MNDLILRFFPVRPPRASCARPAPGLLPLAAALVVLALPGTRLTATAAEDVAGHAPRPSEDRSPADYFSQQAANLASPSFAAREQATRNLIEAGIAARAALLPLLNDPDAEVRVRARQIVSIVRESDFRLRLKAFESDVTGQLQHDLPCWDRFRREIGDTREARELFVAMQRAEPALLQALEDNPKEATTQFAERCEAVQYTLHLQNEGIAAGSAGTIATLLFVGGTEDVHVDDQEAVYLDNIVRFPSFDSELRGGSMAAGCRRVLGRWIARNATPGIVVQSLNLAFAYELKEGAELARRVLTANEGPVEVKPPALLALGRFGTSDDVPLAESLFKDARICVRHRGALRELQVQVRDVALAVALHLTSQDLKSYGLIHVVPSGQTLYMPASLWFGDEKERQAAFDKWTAWRAAGSHPAK